MLSQSPHIGSYVCDLHPSAPCRVIGALWTTLALLVLEFVFQGTEHCPHLTLFTSNRALPRTGQLLRAFGIPAAVIKHAITSYKNLVLQEVANIDVVGRKITFEKPHESVSTLERLVLPDHSPTETPDVHELLLGPEMQAASAHLQHLEITLSGRRQARDALAIVSKCACALQHLTIILYHATGMFKDLPRIILPSLPQLRSLNIRGRVPSYTEFPDELLLLIPIYLLCCIRIQPTEDFNKTQ
ncbi:hypothetical protein C8R45DRAFT_1193486 [Mycena sanguinolenta]|nr:hypothetical protein C8R45DRAFT_1193486 [Mycena sanguinolenta]